MLVGTKKKCFPNKVSLICPPDKSLILFTKRKQEKIEVVARPEIAKVTSNCRDKVPVLFAISKLGSISFYCFSAVGLPALISMG